MGPIQSARSGRKRAPMAEINVTPLVDVMLVLLIIFIVTIPVINHAIKVQLPQETSRGFSAPVVWRLRLTMPAWQLTQPRLP